MTFHPVILCGGAGARMWPVSRPDRPKPFVKLFADRSLFQDTVLRLAGLADAATPVIVCGAAHASLVSEQLCEIGVSGQLLVEPEGRDSAPAILAAAAWIAQNDPSDLALVVASDHYIPDAEAFRAAVSRAAPAAAAGAIVTFGVRPSAPSSAYGYIRPGGAAPSAAGVLQIAEFIEKPNAAGALACVDQGFLWNSGNFLFRPDVLLAEARRHAPGALDPVLIALGEAVQVGDQLTLGPAFAKADRISIDFAVMERTAAAAVLPVDYVWSDVGSWDAIWAVSAQDESRNALSGRAFAVDSTGCLVQAHDGVKVLVLDVEDLVIIADAGRVLVARRSRTPDLKSVIDATDLK